MKPIMGSLIMVFLCFPAAALTVIFDAGNTLPISEYLNPQRTQKQHPAFEQPRFSALPVHTPSMQAGYLVPRKISVPYLQVPLFIVGSDDFSKRWLHAHREQLKNLHAVGLLVNVETSQELENMKAVAGDLPISPASGESIAASLNLHSYPALISNTGIEQ